MKPSSTNSASGKTFTGATLAAPLLAVCLCGCLVMPGEQGPEPPESILAEVDETDAHLSWPASRDTVKPVTGYKAFAVQDASKNCTTTGRTGCMITGLDEGKTYTFAVKARNRSGLGPASTPSQSFTISSAPPIASIWTSRSSGITGGLNAVVWTGSQFVAVGDYGTVLTSPDGVTWAHYSTGRWIDLNRVAYGNGRLIALGDTLIGAEFRSVIFTSVDEGVSWTSRTPAINFRVRLAAWGGGNWVLAGNHGMVLTSPNGESWTSSSTGYTAPPPNVTNFAGLTWTGLRFVLLPSFDTEGPLSSPDGINWSRSGAQNMAGPYAAASNGTVILAAGAGGTFPQHLFVMISTDGETWQTTMTEAELSGIKQVVWAGRWIVLESWGDIWTSRDGLWWVRRRFQNLAEIVPTSMAFSGTRLVQVGSFGKILTSP